MPSSPPFTFKTRFRAAVGSVASGALGAWIFGSGYIGALFAAFVWTFVDWLPFLRSQDLRRVYAQRKQVAARRRRSLIGRVTLAVLWRTALVIGGFAFVMALLVVASVSPQDLGLAERHLGTGDRLVLLSLLVGVTFTIGALGVGAVLDFTEGLVWRGAFGLAALGWEAVVIVLLWHEWRPRFSPAAGPDVDLFAGATLWLAAWAWSWPRWLRWYLYREDARPRAWIKALRNVVVVPTSIASSSPPTPPDPEPPGV